MGDIDPRYPVADPHESGWSGPPPIWTDLARRAAFWRRDPRLLAAVVAVTALGAGAFWYRSALTIPGAPSSAATVPSTSPVASDPAVASASPPTTQATVPSDVVVHVAGAVVSPGVIRLPQGARIIDAIDAVGGPLAAADLDRLNLASLVTDGQRIYVAEIGDPPGSGVLPGDSVVSPTSVAIDAVINLNTATAVDLETLPGIGPTLAAAILAERDRRGGFTSIDDLRSVHGIGEGRFADLRERVTV